MDSSLTKTMAGKPNKKKKKLSGSLVNLKYRKQHLIVLKRARSLQWCQSQQRKTLDFVFIRAGIPGSIKYIAYEALRRMLSRKLERLVRFTLPRKPLVMVTAKPKEMRMGKGKGAFSHYQLNLSFGQPLAKVAWCPKFSIYRALYVTKTALKKTSFRFTF